VFQQPTERSFENIKKENNDAAQVVNNLPIANDSVSSQPNQGLDRGLPAPGYLQNGLPSTINSQTASTIPTGVFPKLEHEASLNETQESKNNSKYFTAFQNATEISYLPEDALKEGFGMVKAIKESLKQLEVGSKLRREVWDREIAK